MHFNQACEGGRNKCRIRQLVPPPDTVTTMVMMIRTDISLIFPTKSHPQFDPSFLQITNETSQCMIRDLNWTWLVTEGVVGGDNSSAQELDIDELLVQLEQSQGGDRSGRTCDGWDYDTSQVTSTIVKDVSKRLQKLSFCLYVFCAQFRL